MGKNLEKILRLQNHRDRGVDFYLVDQDVCLIIDLGRLRDRGARVAVDYQKKCM